MDRLLYEFLIICFYGLSLIFLPIFSVLFLLVYCPALILFQNGLLYFLVVSLFALALLATTYLFSLFANIRYLKNAPSKYLVKKEYIGIVVTTNKLRLNGYLFIYFSDIMLLIELLKRKNQPFKLLTKFDKKRFDDMIYDKNCKGLYILGHGSRHGLLISADEMLYYCEYKDAPKKDFVVQLHCNHGKGESLADYLCAKEEFPTDKKRAIHENREYIHNKLKNELNASPFDIFKFYLLEVFTKHIFSFRGFD